MTAVERIGTVMEDPAFALGALAVVEVPLTQHVALWMKNLDPFEAALPFSQAAVNCCTGGLKCNKAKRQSPCSFWTCR